MAGLLHELDEATSMFARAMEGPQNPHVAEILVLLKTAYDAGISSMETADKAAELLLLTIINQI